MPFYKSKNATISERLTGISKVDGLEAAQKLVLSERMGVIQKEANSWGQKEWVKQNGWKLISGVVATISGITTVLEFFK